MFAWALSELAADVPKATSASTRPEMLAIGRRGAPRLARDLRRTTTRKGLWSLTSAECITLRRHSPTPSGLTSGTASDDAASTLMGAKAFTAMKT